ncbi:MAG TPA: NADP-dependent oxidoreductase [Puia sp.]|nr:NADP-dependent oxidoreductase [Puia sp.]
MKAIEIHHYGGPEELKLEEVPKPTINPDDVLVRVYATGVNPIDWKIRKGGRSQSGTFPKILGWDFSGVIEQVGSQVTQWKAGDAVYGRPDPSRNGTYAEYVAVKANEIARKPASIDHKAAAGVALAGLTAWQALFEHGQLQAGQRVLIHGAAGGVGIFAVQFAKWKGAYVIGTSSEQNILFLEELGADEVIDYRKEDFSRVVADIDLVVDTIGGKVQEDSMKVLRQGGTLVSTVGIQDPEALKARGIRGVAFMAQSGTADLEQIASLIDSGAVIPVVSKILPLKDAAEAQRLSEEGHTRGKIVLQVVEDGTN